VASGRIPEDKRYLTEGELLLAWEIACLWSSIEDIEPAIETAVETAHDFVCHQPGVACRNAHCGAQRDPRLARIVDVAIEVRWERGGFLADLRATMLDSRVWTAMWPDAVVVAT
jgi:hypothetical protein